MDNYPDFQIPLHSPTFSPIPLLWRRDIPTPLQRPEFPYCRGIPLRVVTLLLAQAPSLACLTNNENFPAILLNSYWSTRVYHVTIIVCNVRHKAFI